MYHNRIEYKKGQKFGEVTLVEEVECKITKTNRRLRYGKFKCKCGNEFISLISSVKFGLTKSCGCNKLKKITKHGLSNHKVYNIWKRIKDRCYNKNDKHYKDYGGRGISLYEEWINDVKSFYDYVINLPNYGAEGYSLDRINNDGNYEPGNLRCATPTEQAMNTRSFLNKKKYYGVTFDKRRKKYYARIYKRDKDIYLGSFENKEEARLCVENYLKNK